MTASATLDWAQAVAAFGRAFQDLLRQAPWTGDPAIEEERGIFLDLLRHVATPVAPAEPHARPACRFLPAALAAAPRAAAWQARLAEASGATVPGLRWLNKYQPASEHAALFDGFAFCDLIGPDGSQPSEQVTLGFVLLGPGLTYPFHRHPARELYYVLSGAAGWAVDEGPFRTLPAGSFVLHREDQPHAMRTAGEPLLAISAWRGAIRGRSSFVPAGGVAP